MISLPLHKEPEIRYISFWNKKFENFEILFRFYRALKKKLHNYFSEKVTTCFKISV